MSISIPPDICNSLRAPIHPPPPPPISIQSTIAKQSLTRQRRQNLLLSRGVESNHLRHTRRVAVHKRCPDSRQTGLPEQRRLARDRSHGVIRRYRKEDKFKQHTNTHTHTHKGATALNRRNRSQRTFEVRATSERRVGICGHHIMGYVIGLLLSAQPKMADTRQLDLSWGIPSMLYGVHVQYLIYVVVEFGGYNAASSTATR